MSIRKWALIGVAAALAAALQAPAPGATVAEDSWGPVHRFERNPAGQSLTVDGRDVTTVAWGSQRGWPEPVKVARRTARGRWQAPVTLGAGYDPVVAADAAGNVVAAWRRDRGGFTTGVWVSRKPAGHGWTTPVRISRDKAVPGYPDGESIYGAGNLDVAVRSGGAALVTWEWGDPERGVPYRVQAVYRPAGRAWSEVTTLSQGAGGARATIAPNGRAWVAYGRHPATGPTRVMVRSRPAAGPWGAAERIGSGSLGAVEATGRGDVVAVFARGGRVRTAVRHRTTGAWDAPTPVTPASVRARRWSVSLNAAGAAAVGYLVGQHRVDVVRRRSGGRWTEPRTLADTSLRLSGTVATINRAGDAFVGWDNSYGIWGRYRAAGEGWRPATAAQEDTGQVDVLEATQAALTPSGRVVLLWDQEARPLRARVLRTS
ncbi:hypothetical protein E8D34_07770 [Nocardioides sp. GY 10113]|uniref:hypothetical protein n=1 Tax=Nocardioides sp. GY 10113 TaxID=2569761 RepID=UPI0010A88956|nr:hypothetical protein [Nocardioides sp. GY 10113]TIC87582.1 hypothetical protein E8D34_07770 [Nocardioides sp. GY 10113]